MQSAVSTALPPRRRLVLRLILRITPMIHAGIEERQVEIFVLMALLSLVSKPLLASRIWLRLPPALQTGYRYSFRNGEANLPDQAGPGRDFPRTIHDRVVRHARSGG